MAKRSSEEVTQLEALEKEAIALSAGRKIQTEEGRYLCNLILRMIELQRYGTTKTGPLKSHNA